MGDPGPPATVEPPCHRRLFSRPGPVCSEGNGVSQTASSGKYTSNESAVLSGSDLFLDSSTFPDAAAAVVQTEPAERRFLTVYYQNVRGLRTKTNETFLALCRCDYDVIVFTETWLTEAIKDAELTKNYKLFRCDRNPESSSLLRGGGVLIAAKAKLGCKAVELLNCESLEQTVIRLTLPLQTLFVCCVYIRPVSDPATYATHAAAVQQVIDLSKESDSVLVVGDYNLPNLIWYHDDDTDSLLPVNASSEQEVTLVESMLPLGLTQENDLPNAFGKLLDLVFVSDNVSVELFEPPCPLLKVDQHHNPLLMQLEYRTALNDNTVEPVAVFDFKRCDYTTLNERILAVDWLTFLDAPCVNSVTEIFYEKLFEIFNEVVPRKSVRICHRYKQPWWNDDLRLLRNRLRKATSRFLSTKTAWDKVVARNIEEEYLNLQQESFQNYINDLQNDDILKVLSSVDPSKGPGPDGLPPVFVKSCANSLVVPVSVIFNKSLEHAIFPDIWKLASISPIHKSGNVSKVENYRPISILSCLAKVLEKVVYDRLFPAVRRIISANQHGFMRNRSTTTNLLSFVSPTINVLESGGQVDAVYIDFEKAFDKVPHTLTIKKLKKLGLPDWIVAWLHSYLTSRKAFVNLRVTRSDIFDIPSCVPQGSHLGPLIFILFVNELNTLTGSSTLMYANDLKLYRTVKSHVDCLALQADVDTLLHWCDRNGMTAHAKKCKVLSFTRSRNPIISDYSMNGQQLDRVDTFKDLGVVVDSKLRFNQHIALTTAKAFAMLGFLKRSTKHFDDPYSLKSLFCSLVRSVLEYAVVVWAPFHETQVTRIERVQRTFVRYAFRKLRWNDPLRLPPYEQRCALFNLPTLARRRVFIQRLLVFDHVKDSGTTHHCLVSRGTERFMDITTR
ncbi:uncharacterized protein LOC120415988 [Culex pipiens pallens]|uniref:uncharacterized protein LOC120415988 n=1 Tax=Culex pipiens pallens TaxID=42434 RepID=UPI001953EF61|nr:uncharacterized protein LOC120415988 [Culex pipiens pallens]